MLVRFCLLAQVLFGLAIGLYGAEAYAKPKAGKAKIANKRKPASKGPSRALLFVCKDEAGNDQVLGNAVMSVDLRDVTLGTFGMSIYVRSEKSYTTKSLSGTYTNVPNGFIFRARWPSASGEYAFFHLHPAEKTSLPTVEGKIACETSGQLESQ